MFYFKCILSWFAVGLVCAVIGNFSDKLLYKKDFTKEPSHYIWASCFGYTCFFILISSWYRGLKKWIS